MLRNQNVAVACQGEGGHTDFGQSWTHIKLLHQTEPVRHDALIGLPALTSYELEQWSRRLLLAKKEVEKLVDKGIVGGQWIASQNGGGHVLKHARYVVRTDPLNYQTAHATRIARCQLQCQHTTERNA